MIVIRLQRTGRENTPTYRIVVAEKSAPVKGKFLEIVGHYLPSQNPAQLEHNEERIQHWVKNGAIPSNTLARILSKKGVKGLEKFVIRYAKRKAKSEQAASKEAPKAAAPEATKEASAKADEKVETPLSSRMRGTTADKKEASDSEKKEG